jgi:hypothetical protein
MIARYCKYKALQGTGLGHRNSPHNTYTLQAVGNQRLGTVVYGSGVFSCQHNIYVSNPGPTSSVTRLLPRSHLIPTKLLIHCHRCNVHNQNQKDIKADTLGCDVINEFK